MTFSPEQTAQLVAPLSKATVRKNPRGFDYIEGWHAIAEANRIFGHGEWDRLTEELRQLGEPREVNGNQRIAYFARVRIIVRADGGVIVRDGCGYGSGADKDIGQAHESAIKEAETDAMKRALMTFGNPFGLALYEKPSAGGERTNVADPKSAAEEAANAAINALASLADARAWKAANAEMVMALDGPAHDRVVSLFNRRFASLKAPGLAEVAA